jgi:hypothetical protein
MKNYKEILRSLQSCIFRDIMTCSLFRVNWHLRETCCLPLQNQRISQQRNQHKARSKHSLDNGGDMVLKNITWLSMDYMALYPISLVL